MRQWILVGALVGGCDAGLVAESPAPVIADVVPDVAPCPPRETLDALAKATWGGASVRPKCTTMRAHTPLTFHRALETGGASRYDARCDRLELRRYRR